MKNIKRYYAVASDDGLGIYSEYSRVQRICECLRRMGHQVEVMHCTDIKEARHIAILHYNLFQEAEELYADVISENYFLPLNQFLFKREI